MREEQDKYVPLQNALNSYRTKEQTLKSRGGKGFYAGALRMGPCVKGQRRG